MSITSFARNRFFRADYYNEEILKKEYRALSMKYHPDMGGSKELFIALTAEYDLCVEFLQKNPPPPPPPPPKPMRPIRRLKFFKFLSGGPFHKIIVSKEAFQDGATIFCMLNGVEVRLDVPENSISPVNLTWNNHSFQVEAPVFKFDDGFEENQFHKSLNEEERQYQREWKAQMNHLKGK